MKKGLLLLAFLLVGLMLFSGCAEEAQTADDHYDQDHSHDEEITAFEIIDRRAEEVTAYVHGDHWHGSLPIVLEGENISLGAYVEEMLLDGDHHALGVALAEGAEEGIVSFDFHCDHVYIIGEQEGETKVLFQFIHDGDVEYVTPPIKVVVGHDHGHDHDHDHGEDPYEWSGIFSFDEGSYIMEFKDSGDPSVEMAFMPDEGDRNHSDHMAYHVWEEEMQQLSTQDTFEVELFSGYRLELNPEGTDISFIIAEDGEYLLYLEHMPWEFNLKIYDVNGLEVAPKDEVEY